MAHKERLLQLFTLSESFTALSIYDPTIYESGKYRFSIRKSPDHPFIRVSEAGKKFTLRR